MFTGEGATQDRAARDRVSMRDPAATQVIAPAFPVSPTEPIVRPWPLSRRWGTIRVVARVVGGFVGILAVWLASLAAGAAAGVAAIVLVQLAWSWGEMGLSGLQLFALGLGAACTAGAASAQYLVVVEWAGRRFRAVLRADGVGGSLASRR